MLSPGCFVEEEFTQGDHLTMVWVQKNFPYLLTDGAPSWLSGYFTRDAFSVEIFFQALNLSGLSTPLHSFKSNKKRQSKISSMVNKYLKSI
jgi:hypothetical protein